MSDLPATTPIVTFAIIFGSVISLAQLVGKAGDNFIEKNVAPDVNKVDRLPLLQPAMLKHRGLRMRV